MKLRGFTKGFLSTINNKIFTRLKCSLFPTAFCLLRPKIPCPHIHHPGLPASPCLPLPPPHPNPHLGAWYSFPPPHLLPPAWGGQRGAAPLQEPGAASGLMGLKSLPEAPGAALAGLSLPPSQPPTAHFLAASEAEPPTASHPVHALGWSASASCRLTRGLALLPSWGPTCFRRLLRFIFLNMSRSVLKGAFVVRCGARAVDAVSSTEQSDSTWVNSPCSLRGGGEARANVAGVGNVQAPLCHAGGESPPAQSVLLPPGPQGRCAQRHELTVLLSAARHSALGHLCPPLPWSALLQSHLLSLG